MEKVASKTWIQPIFLLADSQLLFRRGEGDFLMDRVRLVLDENSVGAPKAAYLGASNGDQREFYDLFVAAMEGIAIGDCRMIPSSPFVDDYAYLDQADLILLAGGEVERGWNVFRKTGLDTKVIERYYGGAILIGVSAGAVQLGLRGWQGTDLESGGIFNTFQLVPSVVDVHNEPEWQRLRQIVPKVGEHGQGLGIPIGGGAIFHPDWSVEPIRYPLTWFTCGEDGVKQSLIFP